jgi:ketosteroid isomerase-like protein
VRTAGPDVVHYLERGFECWSRRAIGEMMDMYAPDAELDISALLLDENVLHGRDEIGAYYDRMWETWSEFGWRPCEYAELGEGHYAVVVRLDAEGRGSGTPVVSQLTIFYEVVDGLVARQVFEPGRSAQLQGRG